MLLQFCQQSICFLGFIRFFFFRSNLGNSSTRVKSLVMERDSLWDVSLLLRFLTQCEHQTLQLEANLEGTTASSDEHCKYLLQQMRSNLEEAISLANVLRNPEGSQPPLGPDNTAASDSPPSHSGSPRSDNSERAFKEHERREMRKKR